MNKGHLAYGGWTEGMKRAHINLWEQWASKKWLHRHPEIRETTVDLDMENVTPMPCLQSQGTAHSDTLLTLTEEMFSVVVERGLSLSARYVRGRKNGWADALSRFKEMLVEWHLHPQVFESLALVSWRWTSLLLEPWHNFPGF